MHSDVFEFMIDFNSPLKKIHLDHLKALFNNNLKNEILLKNYEILFTNYAEYVHKNKLSLYDFLKNLQLESQKLEMTIKEILEKFPIKYPRHYSLVSNSICNQQELEVIFTLVEDKYKRRFPENLILKGYNSGDYVYSGQCTNYLAKLEFNSKVIITDIKNNFVFPMEKFFEESTPIIYICNGTGITPCISFLKEIYTKISQKHLYDLKKVGQLAIFTGFRNAKEDKNETIYEDYIEDTVNKINLNLYSDAICYKRCLSTSEGKINFI